MLPTGEHVIAAQIFELQGEYALALKGNQGTLDCDVVRLVEDGHPNVDTAKPMVEADHGALRHGRGRCLPQVGWLVKQHQWPVLKVVG
jgi:hypothetical protein